MRTFGTVQEAMEFLIQRILEQARRKGIELSEIERKMMYFSETAWTLPDIAEINEEFDRHYDPDAYEQKVGKLVYSIQKAMAPNTDESREWNEALRTVRSEDHYLLVLIDAAG